MQNGRLPPAEILDKYQCVVHNLKQALRTYVDCTHLMPNNFQCNSSNYFSCSKFKAITHNIQCTCSAFQIQMNFKEVCLVILRR